MSDFSWHIAPAAISGEWSVFEKCGEDPTRSFGPFSQAGAQEFVRKRKLAVGHQEAPAVETGRFDPIVEAVRADMHRRSQLGIQKYGAHLGENPLALKGRLQHAYEEALDLAIYLKWAINDLEGRGL